VTGLSAGGYFWLEQRNCVTWQAWKTFVAEYEPLCRPQPLLVSLFCISLYGDAALDPPVTGDVCLAIHRWEGQVGPLDSLMFASSLLYGRELTPLRYEIISRIIANLSLWDADLAQHLAEEPDTAILEPNRVFAEAANTRGWNGDAVSFDVAWSRGAANRFGGRRLTHPAALPDDDKRRQIRHAVWSAEMAV